MWILLAQTLIREWFSPNPYKQYRPWDYRPLWLHRYFLWQNKAQLRQMKITAVTVKQGHHLECLDTPPMPLMMVCNHIGFSDPHALLEPMFSLGVQAKWLAGVEPFEVPIKAFHLTGNGSFSIDRGVLDRQALQYAQQVLTQHTHGLVVFPEGEAHFDVSSLQPFQEGGAALLRKALQTAPVVGWLPVHISYQWAQPASTKVIQATLYQTALALAARLQCHLPPYTEPLANETETAPLVKAIHVLCKHAFLLLLKQDDLPNPLKDDCLPSEWPKQAEFWLKTTLHNLGTEHGLVVEVDNLVNNPLELMTVKNQLRSIIVRKARAMPMGEWHRWQQQCVRWEKTSNPLWLDRQGLTVAEWLLAGRLSSQQDWPKRVAAFQKCVNMLQPNQQTTRQQRQRWENQLQTCRRLKYAQLLLGQVPLLANPNPSWAVLEACLQQLWLLVTHKQRYHGPKQAVITVGPLQTLTTLSKEDLPTAADLTRQFKEAIETLATT